MLSEEKTLGNRGLIGALMKDRRVSLGYTQKAFADVLGIEYYTLISQMERGHMTVPPTLWGPIAEALKIDRQEWVLQCLREIQPEVYDALFGDKAIAEASAALRALEVGSFAIEIGKS